MRRTGGATRPSLDAQGQRDAGRSPAGASRTLEPENHVDDAFRQRMARFTTVLAGAWSERSQVSGFSEHSAFDVTCSRMKGLTSVGEWLSLVEHLVRDTTEHRDLKSKPLIRRCLKHRDPDGNLLRLVPSLSPSSATVHAPESTP